MADKRLGESTLKSLNDCEAEDGESVTRFRDRHLTNFERLEALEDRKMLTMVPAKHLWCFVKSSPDGYSQFPKFCLLSFRA